MGGRVPATTRRGLLRASGGLFAASLAGCQLLGGGSEESTPGGEPGDGTDGETAQRETATSTPTPEPPAATIVDRLGPPERVDGARFGADVALDGNRAIVGASRTPVDGDPIGSAHVFERAGERFDHVATLVPDTSTPGAAFGQSVAIDGDIAVVGAPGESYHNRTRMGAAYVFERTEGEWGQTARLISVNETSQTFGTDIAVADGTVLVGVAPNNRLDDDFSGTAYIFEQRGDEWVGTTQLNPRGGDNRDVFGSRVALEAGQILVGAPRTATGSDVRPGAAVGFRADADGWREAEEIRLTRAGHGAQFGSAISLDGTAVAIGAPAFEHPDGATAGAVGVFERSEGSWTLQEALFPPRGEAGDRFAGTVALGDGRLLVGAPGDDNETGAGAGTTFVFERTSGRWGLGTTLTIEGEEPNRQFGHAVALDGATGLASAIGDAGVEGTRAGSVAVLDLDP